MQIPFLIEPKVGGGFRAIAGEPFHVSAEAESEETAARRLETMLRDRLKGARLAFLELENGDSRKTETPLHFEPLPTGDWFFETMREAIDENRRHENEAQG